MCNKWNNEQMFYFFEVYKKYSEYLSVVLLESSFTCTVNHHSYLDQYVFDT